MDIRFAFFIVPFLFYQNKGIQSGSFFDVKEDTISMIVIENCIINYNIRTTPNNNSYIGIKTYTLDTIWVITEESWGNLVGDTISCIVSKDIIHPSCKLIKPTNKRSKGTIVTAYAFENVEKFKGKKLLSINDKSVIEDKGLYIEPWDGKFH